ASDQPYVNSRTLVARLDELNQATTLDPVRKLDISSVLAPMLTRRVEAHAREDVIMAGAAVLTHKARHGQFPDRLQQSTIKPVLDPFAAGTLRYRREGDSFVVYS